MALRLSGFARPDGLYARCGGTVRRLHVSREPIVQAVTPCRFCGKCFGCDCLDWLEWMLLAEPQEEITDGN